ncbi:hypothetical protein GW777_07625, partial [Candidatus Peregrinibacteria bacterium]|nr:hypothetical protein [Candidatus Peregrinibacteria bacterium]
SDSSGGVSIGYNDPGTAKLAIDGNVGIGTTAPEGKLDVNGGIISRGAFSVYSTEAGQTDRRLTVNTNVAGLTTIYNYDGGDTLMYPIQIGSNTAGTGLTINAGNVGIGTTGPNAKLDVTGNIYTGTATQPTTGNGLYIGGPTLWAYDYSGGTGYKAINISGRTISLNTDVWEASPALYIDSNRNVGIGTASPGNKLQVHNYAAGNQTLFMLSGGTGVNATAIGDAVTIGLDTYNSGAYPVKLTSIATQAAPSHPNNNFYISTNTNGTDNTRFFIKNDGNVGIGTTAPTSRLTANTQSPSANALLFNVQNTGSNVFSVDAEGDFFYDGTGSSPSADVAEIYPTTETGIVSGEIVSLSVGDSNAQTVIRPGMASDPNLLGVVTTKPALLLGSNVESGVAVALIGRVPVKVNDQNGVIVKGDYVTSSSTPGVGMKATVAGMVVGRALEDVRCEETSDNKQDTNLEQDTSEKVQGISETCTTMVFTNLSWYDPTHEALALTTTPIDTAKYKDLTTDTMTVNQTLSVLGASTLSDTTITGTLNIGLLSIENSSINVAGGILNLQDAYGAGNIQVFGGKIVMTTDGSVQLVGSLSADSIEVNTATVHQGITIFDEVTGLPTCVTVREGVVTVVDGACVK